MANVIATMRRREHGWPKDDLLEMLAKWFPVDREAEIAGGLDAVHAACFSEDGDQLGQWRAYGSGGGIALGFPTDGSFQRLAESNGFHFVKVEYRDDTMRESAQRIVDRYFADVLPLVDEQKRSWGGAPPEFQEDFETALIYLVAQSKHEAFEEEREWRICRVVGPPEPATHYRAARSLIVPYSELKIDAKVLETMQVRVGPCPDPGMLLRGVASVLRCDLDDDRLYLTEAPYRDW